MGCGAARAVAPPLVRTDLHLFVLLLVPVVTGVIGFRRGKRRITPGEMGLQIALVAALMYGGYHVARWTGVQDYEIWNGRIAKKTSGVGGCCHSYPCNCRQECSTDDEGNSSCVEVCDTCYEHSYDDTYSAYSTNDERVYHSGCHPPGSGSPVAYQDIRIGEPTAWEHRFTNYVRAAPDALIQRDPSYRRFAAQIPDYPRVRGWKADRFLFVGIDPPVGAWRSDLAEVNADLGAPHQVNVVVVVVAEADPAYFDALRAAWLGGKKNDVVLVVGAPAFPELAWARVMAWHRPMGAEDELIGALTHRIETLGTFDGGKILAILRDQISRSYVRRPFAEFAYLMAQARPTPLGMLALVLIGLLSSGAIQYAFARNRHRMRHETPDAWLMRQWRRLQGLFGR